VLPIFAVAADAKLDPLIVMSVVELLLPVLGATLVITGVGSDGVPGTAKALPPKTKNNHVLKAIKIANNFIRMVIFDLFIKLPPLCKIMLSKNL
jgi:hypothetical protein